MHSDGTVAFIARRDVDLFAVFRVPAVLEVAPDLQSPNDDQSDAHAGVQVIEHPDEIQDEQREAQDDPENAERKFFIVVIHVHSSSKRNTSSMVMSKYLAIL